MAQTLGEELIAAAGEAPLRRVEELLDAGAPIEAKTQGGATALVVAARYGRLDVMRLLLSRGADPNAASSDGEITALGQALASPAVGKSAAVVEAVKLLLDAGADADRADAFGWTPLMKAIADDDADAMALLLSRGADPLKKNEAGETPADLARRASPKTRERFEKLTSPR